MYLKICVYFDRLCLELLSKDKYRLTLFLRFENTSVLPLSMEILAHLDCMGTDPHVCTCVFKH